VLITRLYISLFQNNFIFKFCLLRLEIFLFNLFKIVKFEELQIYKKRIFSLSIIITKSRFFVINFTHRERERKREREGGGRVSE